MVEEHIAASPYLIEANVKNGGDGEVGEGLVELRWRF